jgi:hypothetical protein
MEIKNCPFCGAKADICYTTFGDNSQEYYRAQCQGDDAHCLDNWQETQEDAAKVWNVRFL